MQETIYSDLSEITKLQFDIMKFIGAWAREKKVPIPQRVVILKMESMEVGQPTTLNALHGLLLKGYLRRAVIISNKTYYVQLRSV